MKIAVYYLMLNNDYPTAGALLYQKIVGSEDECDKIVLDMDGVSLLPSMFLNPSLGRLIKEKGLPYLKDKISFVNIKASDSRRLKEYVARFT